MGKCDLANLMLKNCLDDPSIQNIKPIRRDIFEKMYKVNKECGDFKIAFEYQEKYFKLRDSINNNITKKSLANLSSMHELETQKQQNQLLQKEKELILVKQEQEVSELYTWIISFTLLFLVLVIGNSILVVHRYSGYCQPQKLSRFFNVWFLIKHFAKDF